jgi:hypothetical protein
VAAIADAGNLDEVSPFSGAIYILRWCSIAR